MYNNIVADIPNEPNKVIKVIADTIRIYCILASFHRSDDIFSENIGISDTRSRDVATAIKENAMIITLAGTVAIRCDSDTNPQKFWPDSAAEENVTINADQNMA